MINKMENFIKTLAGREKFKAITRTHVHDSSHVKTWNFSGVIIGIQ